MNFLILAAGKSSRIYKNIKKPKSLLKVKKKTLISHIIDKINQIRKNKTKIYIVTGFKQKLIKSELFKKKNIKYIHNKDFAKKDMMSSLILGLKNINDDTLMIYSDIYFDKKIITEIIKKKKKYITLPVLKNWKKIWKFRNKNIFEDAEDLKLNKKLFIKKIGSKIKNLNNSNYQYMGLVFFPKNKIRIIIKIYNKLKDKNNLHVTRFLNILIKNGYLIKAIPISAFWYEFDDYDDYKKFKRLAINNLSY